MDQPSQAEGDEVDFQASRAGLGATAVPDSLIVAVLGGPTYEPDTNTLDAVAALVESHVEVEAS